jgi:hypothetical protein
MVDTNTNSPATNQVQAFADEVRALVNETAPSRFALVSEWVCDDGESDACVEARGLADPFDGTVQVTSTGSRRLVSARSAERAASLLGKLTGGPVRVEWLGPAPVIA